MTRMGERAQSATIGVALILAVTILGTIAIVALGGAALTDTQDRSEFARAEQSMTLFDSQAAQVGLGDSSSQSVTFGQSEGTYSVNETAGEISIIQLDCDDDDSNDDGDNIVDTSNSNEDDAYILEPTDLGKVIYETGDGTLAYQGGGVWRETDGGATMVSPPEFHYRGATLTLPVILTRGSGAVSGSATASVSQGQTAVPVYPNGSDGFPDRSGDYCWEEGDPEPFENPVQDGSVIVRIESDYARAWGQYFDQRTEGVVSFPEPNVVTVELISITQLGEFDMPGEGGSIPVRGASGDHATEEFTIRVRPDDSDSADFNNLQWSWYVDNGNYEFEIHLKKSGSSPCPSTGITADVSVYFSANDGTDYQGWHGEDAFEAECADLNGDGDEEIYMDIEFVDDEDSDGNYVELDSDDPELEYESLSSSDLEHYNPNGNFQSTTTFSGHGDWESETYDSGTSDTESIDRLVNHYFAEMPEDLDLTVDDKNSDTINEDPSYGTLFTGAGGKYVTYLHVTKNEIDVQLEA